MTNSSLPTCQVGDRIECGKYFGTIKYIGPVQGTPSIWLGIDWDCPERGKHNGTLNGKQYFTTKHPKSGSFVRPEKVNFGRSALNSIESRYGQTEDEFTAKINQQKKILLQQNMNAPFFEMVGFDKVFNKQKDFAALKIINLREQNVNSAGPALELSQNCPNIEELDISKNLLSSWLDIFIICDQLKNLQWLNVSENMLEMPDSYTDYQFSNLRVLICGSMCLNWDDIEKITSVFPMIEELRAPHNEIERIGQVEGKFTNLHLLDIEGNNIQLWTEICKLSEASKLEQLIIENIGLEKIEFQEDSPEVAALKSIKKLCLVNNLISDWDSIGELNRMANLTNLKISKNPFMTLEHHETVHQIIIAKIANLIILNGVEIEPGERRGAEYDYIKKYGLEWLKVKGTENESQFLKSHKRYLELIQKYGEPEESELVIKPKIIQSSLIQLQIKFEDFSIEKKLPPSMTVQKLIMLTKKLFHLSDRPNLIYKSSTDDHIEISLNDELKEIGVYSMQDGDKIIVSV